ncbi:42053_t:CDS:2 [Gigaspora margarita]|uniref:42053_t:CDS:1 n=1 Tax=Gigaspora margarita TaxID=4874 RepID=A0ABM8VYE8_GIGMA|nr:42053_t:CDS:2 [Gigaspora margarita]
MRIELDEVSSLWTHLTDAALLLFDPISSGVGRIRQINQVVIPTIGKNNEAGHMLELFFQINELIQHIDKIFDEIEQLIEIQNNSEDFPQVLVTHEDGSSKEEFLPCIVIPPEGGITKEQFLISVITPTPSTPERNKKSKY